VQLTFHENDTVTIDGGPLRDDRADMDYYKDPAAHILLEVFPNALTHTLTNPARSTSSAGSQDKPPGYLSRASLHHPVKSAAFSPQQPRAPRHTLQLLIVRSCNLNKSTFFNSQARQHGPISWPATSAAPYSNPLKDFTKVPSTPAC